MTHITYEVRDGVAIVTLARPPVNSLDWATRLELLTATERALADTSIEAIVLTGGATAFSAGADIKEFAAGLGGHAMKEPALPRVVNLFETSAKPTVAAVAGVCMGGGLELALGCHHRLVAANARLALPEINLGLLPGAGGTQRFPRLVGVEAALKLILSGESISAEQAVQLGLAQAAEGDLLVSALTVARTAARAGKVARTGARRAEVLGGQSVATYFDEKRAALAQSRAKQRCVDAVQAAVEKPLAEGLRLEAEYFRELIQTEESQALQYSFFSERLAAVVPGMDISVRPRAVTRLGVVGAGTMGSGIAICAVDAGLPVTLVERSSELLQKALDRIRSHYGSQVKKGRISAADLERRLALIETATGFESLAASDLVIEAVYEDLAVKQSVFRELDSLMQPGAVLASNTSTLDLNQIAAVTRRPTDVIGLHFFSPANVMRLLEIVRGRHTSAEVLATALSFGKRIGKVGVVAGVCDGFIGNRMLEEYLRQAYFLLDEGALPWQVDAALEQWGMAMGPFAVMDLAGGDIGWSIRKRRTLEQPDRPYSKLPDRLCELGRYGQKTGAGWYRYEAGNRVRQPDPLVEGIVEQNRRDTGLPQRLISRDEIVDRCILALANEGAKLLGEGIAQRASDIDVVYRNGYGFPPHRGGPMYFADAYGLERAVARMEQFRGDYQGQFWDPAPLLQDHVQRRTSFTALQLEEVAK